MQQTNAKHSHCPEHSFDDSASILRGDAAVLAALPELDELRARVGQHDDLSTDPLLILSRHNATQRRQTVVLLRRKGVLQAAVIFAERCVLGFGIGLLRAGDQAGDGAVIALEAERKSALHRAMNLLLDRRLCHTVVASLGRAIPETAGREDFPGVRAETDRRIMRRYLPLKETLDATLRDRFTAKKRRNLLYYRRSLQKELEIEFIPRLTWEQTRLAMMELAHNSWPHRTPQEIALHCEFLSRHKECFCMGLRTKAGTWLSLVTGWRIGGVTYMPWQLNHAAYGDASLMQVMRTCLIENECNARQIGLCWVGGTVAFQTACEQELCLDVLKQRAGWKATLLRVAIAPLLAWRNPGAFTGGSLMLLLSPQKRNALNYRSNPNC